MHPLLPPLLGGCGCIPSCHWEGADASPPAPPVEIPHLLYCLLQPCHLGLGLPKPACHVGLQGGEASELHSAGCEGTGGRLALMKG